MLAATVLTLIFVPVFYAVIEGWRERGSEPAEEAAHAAVPAGPYREAAE